MFIALSAKCRRTTLLVSASVLVLAFLLSSVSFAAPPSPELLEQLKLEGRLEAFSARLADAKARGMCAAHSLDSKDAGTASQALSFNPMAPDTFRVLVILADFSDKPASGGGAYGTVADFEHLLFSIDDNDNHYSMTEFYLDNSYGNFHLEGIVAGWYRMPNTYAYYVDGQNGFGSPPRSARTMAAHAMLAADPDVDYSLIDNDGNGWVDGVFIVHAGPGAEQTGNDNDIWSHAWSLPYTLTLDGVKASSYTTEPEENAGGGLSTMGVYAHEYGHFIGLPDLYDTDGSSSGIGRWSLMAGGSWNDGGRHPAFMDIWCKSRLGFVDPVNITVNELGREIASSYHNSDGVRIWQNGALGSQYFLVENRRKTGADSWIPGSGLLIFHIDESIGGNSNENHPLVAVEQADGLYELESGFSSGDSDDLWSTLTKTSFDDLSIPSTKTYFNATTQVGVWDISAPDSVMTANFDISYSRPLFLMQNSILDDALYGNGDGVIDVGETVTFTLTLENRWIDAEGVNVTLTSDNPDITFSTPSSYLGSVPGYGATTDNSGDPIVFTVPAGFSPCIDSFFVDVTSDNPLGDVQFGMLVHIGHPKFLVIDDDRGASWETAITDQLFDRRLPFDIHDKNASGSPTGVQLQDYETVIWITGDSALDPLSAADVTAMTSFMDFGGNLWITGQSLVRNLSVDDPTFLADYLRATYTGNTFFPSHIGVAGSPIGDGVSVRYASSTNQTESNQMATVNGSVSNFELPVGGVTGLTYDGSYKLLLLSFGFEGVAPGYEAGGYMGPDAFFSELLGFFYADTSSINPALPSTNVEGELSQLNVLNHVPTFAWSVTDTTVNPIVEYEVIVGTGQSCSNRNSVWASGLIAGSDTSIVYGGPALVDGSTYYFSVQVNNGVTVSEWAAHEFRLNSVGTIGNLYEPIQGVQILSSTPMLWVLNGNDAEDDVLTYDYEVYSDDLLTTLVTSATGVTQGTGFRTGWTVDIPLGEDQTFYWRCRMYDGYEYSEFTSIDSFLVNGVNQAPNSFSLLLPADEDSIDVLYPTLSWQPTTDNDPGDEIEYIVWYSLDETFSTYIESSPLMVTSYGLETPVDSGETYFWKVKAIDLSSAETWSSETHRFYTPPLGCCLGVRGDVNGDGTDLDIVDLTCLVDYLFGAGCAMPCEEEADVNFDGASADIVDLTFVVDYLFGVAPTIMPCY